MERKTLSMRQLMAVLWAGLLGPAVELLPGAAAQLGAAGGLGVLAAGAGMLLSGWLLWRLARESGGVARGLLEAFGPVAGKGILFIYVIWSQILFGVSLRRSAQRLMGGGQRDGAVWFFVGVLGLTALWLARGKADAFGRAGELMFGVLAVVGAGVLVLAVSRGRGENLGAIREWSAAAAGEMILPGIQVLGFGLFVGFLMEPEGTKDSGRSWMKWTAWGCAALAVAQTVALGVFGPRLTLRLRAPFFQLAKGVGVKGAFQRVESVVAAVWVFSDLILLGGLLRAMERIAGTLWPNVPERSVAAAGAAMGIILAVALFGHRLSVDTVTRNILPAGSLILGIGVPVLANLTKRPKGTG